MKILIPMDGSEFAESVLEPVSELAKACAAEVHLLQVVPPGEGTVDWGTHRAGPAHSAGELRAQSTLGGMMPEPGPGLVVESKDQADERIRQEARDYLEHLAHEYFPSGAVVTSITGADAADEILKYARAAEISMIAMATHGRTGIERMLLGSVAGKLLRARQLPVYLIRPEGLSDAS